MKKYLVLSMSLVMTMSLVAAADDWSNPNGSADNFTWANGQNLTNNFGSPTPSGDSLVFLNSNFDAQANDNSGIQMVVDDVLDVDLIANPGLVFTKIDLLLYGDFSITDSMATGGNSVEANFSMDVTSGAFSASDTAQFYESTPGSGFWNDQAIITISPTEGLDQVHLNINGSVIAISDGQGGASTITANSLSRVELQVYVPEPASLLMMALGGLVLIRKR